MSLILDALKRSESERIAKTQDANSLVTSGINTGNDTRKSIPWLPFLIAAVVVNLAILAVILKSNNTVPVTNDANEVERTVVNTVVSNTNTSGQSQPEQVVNSGPRLTLEMPTRAEMPPPREVKAATALAEELLAKPQSAQAAYDNSTTDSNTSAVLANAAPAVPADFAMIETEEIKPAPVPENPVTLKELNNAGLAEQLSNYEINTHIFNSSDASRSFVLINMKKYREGDTLQGSEFTISRITNEGVVVDHDAGQVLLSNN